MIDPLTEVVALLQPQLRFAKMVHGAGTWRVRRFVEGQPFYCVVLDGASLLAVDGAVPFTLQQDDFVLIPAAYAFTMTSLSAPPGDQADSVPVTLQEGHVRLGRQDGHPEVHLLVGHCEFASPDAGLLVSLLPQVMHVRGAPRLATLVALLGDESRAQRPGREVILTRLLEVLLIEALRSADKATASPGLLRGMADERLAVALRRMHADLTRPWTVAQLAKEAALSRSAFFDRFSRALGVAPMEYLLTWRMALAKRLLLGKDGAVSAVAGRVGYASASAFSVAFTRHVGLPPTHYAREHSVPPVH